MKGDEVLGLWCRVALWSVGLALVLGVAARLLGLG